MAMMNGDHVGGSNVDGNGSGDVDCINDVGCNDDDGGGCNCDENGTGGSDGYAMQVMEIEIMEI